MTPAKRSAKKLLINLALFCVTLFICLVVAEGFFRIQDGQPLFGELPVLKSPLDPELQQKVDWLSLEIAKEQNKDALVTNLYKFQPDARTYGAVRNEIESISKTFTGHGATRITDVMRVWNKKFVTGLYHNAAPPRYTLKMIDGYSFLYTFNSPDSSAYPIYRYFPNSIHDPEHNSAKFNQFGWGGDAVSFVKPANTVRLAFVGASTTQQMQGCPFAYPDYIGKWLNEWASQRGLNLKFEVINAGRVAQKSADFRAIMQYELAPVEPDFVIYYEGKNQFFLNDYSCDCNEEPAVYGALKQFALFRRGVAALDINILEGIENAKSMKVVIAEKTLNSPPDIHSPYLPLEFPQILADLDSIRKMNERINSTLVVCSYAMLTNKEMLTQGMKYAAPYSYWIEELGSVSLDKLMLLNAFENRVFETYCRENNVPFIDVASRLIRLPEAFDDGVHLTCEGMKYHAWIVFLQLLPMIEEKLNNGTLPRPSTQTLSSHPYIQDTFERIELPVL